MGANHAELTRVFPGGFLSHRPGEFAISHSQRTRRPDRKLLQLCSQVADTLNQVLSGECDDDILRSLYVVSVTAAPDAAQLLVVVAPVIPEEPLQPVEVIERLSARAGQLRHAVATSITRRRAPRLIYQFSGNPLAPERESPPLPVSDSDAESRID